jgi:hypothetical protein
MMLRRPVFTGPSQFRMVQSGHGLLTTSPLPEVKGPGWLGANNGVEEALHCNLEDTPPRSGTIGEVTCL